MITRKTLNVQGLYVSYKSMGQGPILLILHGWGSSSESWTKFQEYLAKEGYHVIVPDLPGFGLTLPPENLWGVNEYKNFVVEFMRKLALKKFSIAGHSFGGQIAIQFASDHPEMVEKLILLAPAGIRREIGFKQKVLRVLAKLFNLVFILIPSQKLKDVIRKILYRIIGRRDYVRAKGIMREILKKVVQEDLSYLFPRITIPTLIIWGDKDTATPVKDAYYMKESMSNSSLKIFSGIGHRIRHDAPEKLKEAMVEFLRA